MKFFELNSNKEILIYNHLLKDFFCTAGTGVSDILYIKTIVVHPIFNEVIVNFCSTYGGKSKITKSQWDIIDDKLHKLYLNNKIFTYTIDTTNDSIELVFDAEVGMISPRD